MKKTFFDADSLFYETNTQNVYENLWWYRKSFDLNEHLKSLSNLMKPIKKSLETLKIKQKVKQSLRLFV